MKELFKKLMDVIQEEGYQCIVVGDDRDFCTKVDCMGGSYKGFVMTVHQENPWMFYIDTDKALQRAYNIDKLPRFRFRMDPQARMAINALPESQAQYIINGQLQSFYGSEYYYHEKSKSFWQKLKEHFSRKK